MERKVKRKYRMLVAVLACFIVVLFAGIGFSVDDYTYEDQSRVSESIVTEQPKIEIPEKYNTINKDESTPETNEIPEDLPDAEEVFVPTEPDRYIFPVPGGVNLHYSQTPIYSRTLEDWRSHNGVDLSAAEGEKVIAAADGTVQDVYYDTFYGYTVSINHTGGTETVYANLSGDVTVAPGQTVSEGELIGYAGSTASVECEEDGHIHFEMKRDGKYINPAEYLTAQ